VFVDPDQIETLILHLAGNARDAMPYGGQLKISVENTVLERPSETLPAGDYVALRICDTGFGMPPQVVEHAFEPFFTTKENGLGGGLGLATCYGIVRQAGGDINVASEVGAGTIFTVLFPRGIEAVTESIPMSREIASAPGGTETILLVEDDPMVLTITSRILSERGYRVYTAADGEQATRFILQHQHPIDLVLTDLMMPKMSGSELVERLDLSHPNLKVLYATGYRDQAIGADSLLDPDRPVLLKPYRPRDLLLKVREVLDG
jgi:CheY-like chemotaxis protein